MSKIFYLLGFMLNELSDFLDVADGVEGWYNESYKADEVMGSFGRYLAEKYPAKKAG